MGPLLKIIGLLTLLGGLGLVGSAYLDNSWFGILLGLCVLGIGVYALIASSNANQGGAPTADSAPRPTSARPGPSASTSGLKVCPDCAETVNAAARKCRHCGFLFDESTITAPLPTPPPPTVVSDSGLRERLARTIGAPLEETRGPEAPRPTGGLAAPGSDLFKARARAQIRTFSLSNALKGLSPLVAAATMRLYVKFGEQWCGECGELMMPQVSVTGAVEDLWRCTACGTLAAPTPRHR